MAAPQASVPPSGRLTFDVIRNGRDIGDPHYDYKLQFLWSLADQVQPGELQVYMGDFNVAPLDTDVWDIAAVAAFFALSNRLANVTGMRPNAEFYMLGRQPK